MKLRYDNEGRYLSIFPETPNEAFGLGQALERGDVPLRPAREMSDGCLGVGVVLERSQEELDAYYVERRIRERLDTAFQTARQDAPTAFSLDLDGMERVAALVQGVLEELEEEGVLEAWQPQSQDLIEALIAGLPSPRVPLKVRPTSEDDWLDAEFEVR